MRSNTHKGVYICLEEDLKKRFHATCVIRGKKMSQAVIDLIEKWLETNGTYQLIKEEYNLTEEVL